MLGNLIGAAGSLIGGILGNKSKEKAAQKQYEQQKEFAQSGIQWKVEDAKKAGIHPLYALGANTVSYAPQSVGSTDFSFLGSAGQNIGRAIDATRSGPAKLDAFASTAQALQLESLKLDNDIKRAQLGSALATARPTGATPGLPSAASRWLIDGQGNAPAGTVLEFKSTLDAADPAAPHAIAGASPDVAYARTALGSYAPVIPPKLAESYEQDFVGYLDWLARNRIAPNFGFGEAPPIPTGPGGWLDYIPPWGHYRPRSPAEGYSRAFRGLRLRVVD